MARLDGVVFDQGRGLIHIPGSVFALARNLVIFAVKYGLAAAMVIASAFHDGLIVRDAGVSGPTADYCLGWPIRFVLKYRGTEDVRELVSQ